MKGLNLFLATLFTIPTLSGAGAETVKNTARTTISRTTANTNNARNTNVKLRAQKNANTTSGATQKSVVSRTGATPTRTSSSVTSRGGGTSQSSRTSNVISRSATTPTHTVARTATSTQHGARRSTGAARAAVKTRESVMNRDFGKCKTVFFECMDEFCANKDAQLKRCACSALKNEFQSTQKSLDAVENNLLDFSQRLLKVNMDPADAAVINQETAGEQAYNATKDKSSAKRTLDEIAGKLNNGFTSAENGGTGLALSWSLGADTAFDTVDSLSGIATTAKSGTALRNAALPICSEMAAEVCDVEDISLVEISYNMAIEQDCNTVKRAYDTMVQNARTKVLDSGALLDMTRLSTYQDNNSDDVISCKAKMLDILSSPSVCGTDLVQCLDISGQYINPATGSAFLTPQLVNLATLIVRPIGNATWSTMAGNEPFVTHLNSKKKYIKPATKNCQDIADDIWDDFIQDALARIKLAQDAKLEEIRQSCTTLMSECISGARESLEEFDSRARTTFGVKTDLTANALCKNVFESCNNVTAYIPDTDIVATTTTSNSGKQLTWGYGANGIITNETYNTILNTCGEIGRGCIINTCKSITGNFGLCTDEHTNTNRFNILARTSCWDQVLDCVSQASDESINEIYEMFAETGTPDDPTQLYSLMYNTTTVENDICKDINDTIDCNDATNAQNLACRKCRIAEQIWGHCEYAPEPDRTKNTILKPKSQDTSTILSWFAKNTESVSCIISGCPGDTASYDIDGKKMCLNQDDVVQCGTTSTSTVQNILCKTKIDVTNDIQNCCPTNQTDEWGNCCMGTGTTPTPYDDGIMPSTGDISNANVCAPDNTSSLTLVTTYTDNNRTNYIFCTGETKITTNNQTTVKCDGQYVVLERINDNKYYYKVPTSDGYDYSVNYFINADKDATNYCAASTGTAQCVCNQLTNGWFIWNGNNDCNTYTVQNWLVEF